MVEAPLCPNVSCYISDCSSLKITSKPKDKHAYSFQLYYYVKLTMGGIINSLWVPNCHCTCFIIYRLVMMLNSPSHTLQILAAVEMIRGVVLQCWKQQVLSVISEIVMYVVLYCCAVFMYMCVCLHACIHMCVCFVCMWNVCIV